MARKHNVDKVYNYIMTETDLSKDQCHELLDVVENNFLKTFNKERKDELTQQSQRDRSLMKMFEENRIVK